MAAGVKNTARIRRCKKARKRIALLPIHRLSVYRSAKNIYAQIISIDNSKVIVASSSLDKNLKNSKASSDNIISGGNINGAIAVGKLIAEKAKANGVEKVAFDASGYKYHGRVKALADAAREGGLQF